MIQGAVEQEPGRREPIQVEEGRILYIPIAAFPWTGPHPPLPSLGPAHAEGEAPIAQLTVDGEEAADTSNVDGCSKAGSLHNQGQGRVPAVTMSGHAQASGIANAKFNDLIDA